MKQQSDYAQRQAAFGRLYNLGQSFSAVVDLPELIRRIVDAALSLSEAEEALIVLTDPAISDLGLRACRRSAAPYDYETLLLDDAPLAAYVQQQGEPLRLPSNKKNLPAELEANKQPAVYVPVSKNSSVIAVLGVLRGPGAQPFAEHTQELLTGLSTYVAISIENARLYQQALDRSRELSMLVESSNAVSSSLNLGSVLNAIARHMMRALDTHWCIISGWDPDRRELSRLAEHRKAHWPRGTGPLLDLQAHTCYQTLPESEQPFPIHQSLSAAEPDMRGYLTGRGLGRILTVPLQMKGSVLGFAELASLHDDGPFTPAQIGHGMRLALELAPLLQDGASPSRSDLISAARMLNTSTGADWATVYSWEQADTQAKRLVAYGSGLWSERGGPQLKLSGCPQLNIVIREQRIAELRSTDANLTPEEAALFDEVGPSAQLILPLVFKSKTVGLVQLYDINPERQFTSREMGLAHTLANQAAIALENAHLVRDLQRSLAELKSMQSHLVHAARLSALGELSMVVAHQINNPLTTIIGDAEMLAQDLPAEGPENESAQAILRAGKRAKQVVERLLTMAHMEDEPRTEDLNGTINETIQLVGPQITREHITLEVELADELPPVKAVPGQLEDVWMNLLINARDAVTQLGTEHGKVRIASSMVEDGTLVEVRVTDNGCGIPSDKIPQIFDPFFTTKPRGKGTGLGLYICRQIVTEHDGEIRLESTPGKGTSVIVTLPTDKTPQRTVYGIYSHR